MKNACKWAASVAVSAGFALGCSDPGGSSESVAEVSQALDPCGETVPANRFVDGFPAYSQCDATTNSAIWSNNGIDTSTTSQGTGWVRTQYSGGYQCTEWAWRYMHFKWNVDYRSGNAGQWCDGTLPSTLVKSTVPVHGDLIVFAPGVCGADSTTGHVAVIDTVDMAGGNVTIVEQNRAGRRNAKQSCAACFLHAVANDGSPGTGSGGAGSGGGSAAGGASGSTSKGGASSGGSRTSSGGRPGSGGSGIAGADAVSRGGAPASGGSVGSSGTFGSGGQALAGGSSAGGSLATGGSFASGGQFTTPAHGGLPGVAGTPAAGGSPVAVTGGAPGTTGSGGADPVSIDSLSEESGCNVGPGSPRGAKGAAFGSLSWLLIGLALRRRSSRRKH